MAASLEVSRLISAMRRHVWLFTACCLAGGAVGVLYNVAATPLYTASADIMVDHRQMRALREIATAPDSPVLDPAIIESQAQVLRSEQVGLAVVKQLNLTNDPAFVPPTWREALASIMPKFTAAAGPEQSSTNADPSVKQQLTALRALNRNLRVTRVPRSFVLQVNYASPSPVRAAEITNAYADAYMREQVNWRMEATQRARSWLQQRTEELRQISVNADLAAQKFRADNNLLATKGTLISEQQFNEMTTQLVAERMTTAQARARYLRIKNIIDSHETESAVAESLNNPVINDLRTKYLDASKRRIDFERKLEPRHIAVVNLKNTMDALSTLLFQELGRIAQTYRNDYEVAAAREKALAESLTKQQSIAVAANDAQVQLRQLEQKAESYKTLYQSYLQLHQEAAQQESSPITSGYVISAANPPLVPSHPRKPLVLAICLALGVLAGAGAAAVREALDRVFRTGEQVRDELGVDLLGMLPYSPGTSSPHHDANGIAPIMRHAIDHPFSAFAETLRSAKLAADLTLKDRSPKVIGVASLLPNEGKSVVAKNFASLLALQGAKTLLIDADFRNPSLTRAIGRQSATSSRSKGLAPLSLTRPLWCEQESGLQILPCIYAEDDPRIAEGLSSATLKALLHSNDQSFECVVIDLPPIGPVVNARGLAATIDAFVFVVEWGVTSRGAIRSALEKERLIKDKLLGVILNKVDMEKLKIYEHFDSDGYYRPHYGNYYEGAEKA